MWPLELGAWRLLVSWEEWSEMIQKEGQVGSGALETAGLDQMQMRAPLTASSLPKLDT